MTLIIGLTLVIISGCHSKPSVMILSMGECERGIVTEKNAGDIQKVWKDAERGDILISGGCYQEHFIKKRR